MVEIALSLVKPDPNVDPTKIGAREWAIDVMERFSGIRFSRSAANRSSRLRSPSQPFPKAPPPLSRRRACPLSSPSAAMTSSFWMTQVTTPSGPTRTGNTIDFIPPVFDTLIKSVTQNMKLWGGPLRLAATAAASTEEGFSKYLKIYGTPVDPGTCFNLVGQFATNGFLFGKVTNCPPSP